LENVPSNYGAHWYFQTLSFLVCSSCIAQQLEWWTVAW
jgi:hypothetical protein